MRPIPQVPTFALAGQPNEGKTTVMATLAEDDAALISPVPGTTMRAQRYPVVMDGEEILVFWDTPGFENTAEALEWFKQHESSREYLPAQFIKAFGDSGKFRQELEIFRPLAEGAAIIYVVDASRPPRAVDRQQIEILRRCGNPRIGVINAKEGRGEYFEEWQRLMSVDFNHRHEFNGHRATFRDRIELLEAVRTVIPEWKPAVTKAINEIERDWEWRLEETAATLAGTLKELVNLRQRETVASPERRGEAERKAAAELKERVRELEVRSRARVRKLFRHRNEHWIMDEVLVADVFAEEVWRVLGLKRWQLAAAGAAVGAIAGGIVDAHLGGMSLLAGAALGGTGGAVLGWLSAGKAVKVTLPGFKVGPLEFGGGQKLGGVQAEARIAPQSNLVWVLIDRLLLYTRQASSWSHGRRDQEKIPIQAGADKQGETSRWSAAERKKVAAFVGEAAKGSGKVEAREREAREVFLRKIREVLGERAEVGGVG